MDTIKPILDQLVSWLSSVAPEVWKMALAQVQVRIWQDFVLAFLLNIWTVIYFCNVKKWVDNSDGEDGWVFLVLMGGAAALAFVVIGVTNVWENIGRIINPNYYAIKELLSLVQGLK